MSRENDFSKWLLCVAVFALLVSCSSSRYAVKLTVTDLNNASVAQKINANTSALLTELNKAFFNNRTPSFNKFDGLNKNAKNTILSIWKITPFRCIETEIIERSLKTSSGWQIRNIPLILKDMSEENSYKEIAINFDNSGTIEDIYFTIDLRDYKEIMMNEGNDVTDLRSRRYILDFVENFRTAFNRKDIDFISKIYSDDALIITGKMIKQTKSSENESKDYSFSRDNIAYQVSTNKEYINKLYSFFKSNFIINVKFEDIEVVRHPEHPDIYGIRLKQCWNTANFSNTGYLFLLMDFKDIEHPLIHMRIWQPENGKQLSEDEIINLYDFEITNEK